MPEGKKLLPSELKTHQNLLALARGHGTLSKDPSTKVGAVLVKGLKTIGFGCNQLPAQLIEKFRPHQLSREDRLALTIHAEVMAVLDAIKRHNDPYDSTLYFICRSFDDPRTEEFCWGGCPCMSCAMFLIQAGIKRIVSLPLSTTPARWLESCSEAKRRMVQSGVEFLHISETSPRLVV